MGVPLLYIADNGELVAAQLAEAAVQTRRAVPQTILSLGQAVATLYEPALVGETPRGETGQLRDTTRHEFLWLGDSLTVFFRQPAERRDYKYAWAVIYGHRVVVFGHDTNRYQPPNPYPSRAWDSVSGEVGATLASTGRNLVPLLIIPR